jgi:hypothetical protein
MDNDSRMMVCKSSVWEEMKDAECRSPVQRVISIQSRDWFKRWRRCVSCGRGNGEVGVREMVMGGEVCRRRRSVCNYAGSANMHTFQCKI